MRFETVQSRLLEHLRTRIRNGESTERGLARLVGLSQPHLHNVLKGVRALAPRAGDAILAALRMSVLDLVQTDELIRQLEQRAPPDVALLEIPFLNSRIGPGVPWSEELSRFERFRVPARAVALMPEPVVARMADDRRMRGVLAAGDLFVIDRSITSRLNPDPSCLYVIDRGGEAVLRWVRIGRTDVYLLAADNQYEPHRWEAVPLNGRALTDIIRGRAIRVPALWPVCEKCGAVQRLRDRCPTPAPRCAPN